MKDHCSKNIGCVLLVGQSHYYHLKHSYWWLVMVRKSRQTSVVYTLARETVGFIESTMATVVTYHTL